MAKLASSKFSSRKFDRSFKEKKKFVPKAPPPSIEAPYKDALLNKDGYYYDAATNTIRKTPVEYEATRVRYDEGPRITKDTFSPEVYYLDDKGRVTKKETYSIYTPYEGRTTTNKPYVQRRTLYDDKGFKVKEQGYKDFQATSRQQEVKWDYENNFLNDYTTGLRTVTGKERNVDDTYDRYIEAGLKSNTNKNVQLRTDSDIATWNSGKAGQDLLRRKQGILSSSQQSTMRNALARNTSTANKLNTFNALKGFGNAPTGGLFQEVRTYTDPKGKGSYNYLAKTNTIMVDTPRGPRAVRTDSTLGKNAMDEYFKEINKLKSTEGIGLSMTVGPKEDKISKKIKDLFSTKSTKFDMSGKI